MYFLMTCSIEHTEEEDNDEGGGREEVTNGQVVKGVLLVYNIRTSVQCMRYDVRKYRDGQKETLVCMYQDLGGY